MGTIVIPQKIVKHVLADFRTALKSEKTNNLSDKDALLRQGMMEGLNFLEGKINAWVTHQRNVRKLKQSRLPRLVTKDITLSAGRYRKFEWYQGNRFISLAFRWGKEQPEPEIGLQIQDVNTLRSEFLVYHGALGYDHLVDLVERKGIRGIRNAKTANEWRPM